MRYYVVADPHGFFTELKTVLEEKGFFTDTEPHKLIICGDLLDRGQEAWQMQRFILELMQKDQVILVRGNHEDFAIELLEAWNKGSYLYAYHQANGTLGTALQLANAEPSALQHNAEGVGRRFQNTPYIQKIIPAMVDFFETTHYIFVHGWIPCTILPRYQRIKDYLYAENWRDFGPEQWSQARMINGMAAAHCGVVEPGKTIVCGHWHTSFGHANYEGICSEFGDDADFSPYYADGIIALDACTAYSRKINCIILED